MDNDKRLVKRIRELLKDIIRHPEEGIGKPERLKFQPRARAIITSHFYAPIHITRLRYKNTEYLDMQLKHTPCR
ncbi:MAG: hypothetical protein HKP58_14675 [Desulfatitalea sp.]|nr:type II toxin-antitoxin system YoeB family toxin [Desulfatitalea sp.]NNK01651.1 hypothetical protein [Desulfatitalea sp.]